MLPEHLRAMFPNASASFLAKNAGVSAPARRQMPAAVVKGPETKRIRQHQGDGMNSWERAYKAELEREWKFIIREVSLPLANGARYKVDFMVARGSDSDGMWTVECHEVKGRALSTGILKIKIAASLYPFWTFRLATKRRKKQGGGWAVETVLP